MRDRILFLVTSGFVAGIAFRTFIQIGLAGTAFVVMIGSVFLAVSLVSKNVLWLGVSLILLSFAGGVLRTHAEPTALPQSLATKLNSEITFEGVVIADPDVREESVRLTISFQNEGSFHKVLVVAPRFPTVRYGEYVKVQGTLVSPEAFETDTGRTFRYDKYLAKDRIFAVMERAHVEVMSERKGIYLFLRGLLSDTKFAFVDALSEAMPEPHASLAAGLLTGGKQGLGKKLIDAFTAAGLVHIVVLSGYNVMILAEGVLKILSLLNARVAAISAGIVVLLFVVTAGAGPASIRAGIMAALAMIARASNRIYMVIRALLISLLLMLLQSPFLLVHDPGFQLSFLATLGMVYGVPITTTWLGVIKNDFLRDMVGTTLAAQIAVLPLLVFQTGSLSTVSLPANVLVLPFIPISMFMAAIAGLGGLITPAWSPVIGLPAFYLLSYVLWVVEQIARIPYATLNVPVFSVAIVLLSYVCLGWWVRKKHLRLKMEMLPNT